MRKNHFCAPKERNQLNRLEKLNIMDTCKGFANPY